MYELYDPIFPIIEDVERYKPVAIEVFNYLNGRINTRNICKLFIAGYSQANFAEFQYPNMVTIHLGSIVENYAFSHDPEKRFTVGRDKVISVLILTITHELYHADQAFDVFRYSTDDEYKTYIENMAESNAEKFIMDNMVRLEEKFNFTVAFDFDNGIFADYVPYEMPDLNEVYRNMINGIFRSNSLLSIYDQAVEKYDTVSIALVEDGTKYEQIVVKIDGHTNSDPRILASLQNCFMTLRRYNGCGQNYAFEILVNVFNSAAVITITIKSHTFEPIEFY